MIPVGGWVGVWGSVGWWVGRSLDMPFLWAHTLTQGKCHNGRCTIGGFPNSTPIQALLGLVLKYRYLGGGA